MDIRKNMEIRKNMTKVIAMYLPQYHRIPENDLWWGNGYTDWKAVKEAKPLFSGHEQPKIPRKKEYYDLSNLEAIRNQVQMANDYEVYGFGIYHYWFSSKQVLLDTPTRLLSQNKDINTHFFLMWDNGSWKRTWSNVKFSNSWAPLYENNNDGPEILAELIYGDEEEWEKHFNYLLPFFEDERYIKIDDKPLFGIFNQDNDSETLKKMFEYWNKLAKENGLNGVAILGKENIYGKTVADYQFNYEPSTHGWVGKNCVQRAFNKAKDKLLIKTGRLRKYKYDDIWKKIIKDFSEDKAYLPGAFVKYDDTPRRGKKSSIVVGESPKLFEYYMKKLLLKCNDSKKEYLFLTAWNEWGEGAYLEPDEVNGFQYLESLKRALSNF